METIIEQQSEKTIIKINGRLDSMNSGDFEKAITPVLEGAMKDITLDCTDFEYISSSGLRLFLTLLKHSKSKGGKLCIKALKPEIKSVFDIAGFTPLFQFE
ncbi:MAG: STAS domain-containing protein [Bacteroidales bacterium]|nr:STAS domain-containing protein [Bacteroidales bacterium]MDD4669828.1 STAS domain-containing protein [Bacteroidales bacterium]